MSSTKSIQFEKLEPRCHPGHLHPLHIQSMPTSLHLPHQQCNPSDHHPSPGGFPSLSSDLLYLLWPVPCLLQNTARVVSLKHKSDWAIHFPYLKLFNGFPAALRILKKALKVSCKDLHALPSFHPSHPSLSLPVDWRPQFLLPTRAFAHAGAHG